LPDEKNTDKTEKKMGLLFGDIGAEAVEWGSPEHLSMQHSHLRGLPHQKRVRPAENAPEPSTGPGLDNAEAPKPK